MDPMYVPAARPAGLITTPNSLGVMSVTLPEGAVGLSGDTNPSQSVAVLAVNCRAEPVFVNTLIPWSGGTEVPVW